MCEDINITVSGIEKLLKPLNPTKASGPDNISPRVLKEVASVCPITNPDLQSLYEIWHRTKGLEICPHAPVFKKGERTSLKITGPSPSPAYIASFFEHVVVSTIMGYAEKHQILRPEQHDFRQGRSCESLAGLRGWGVWSVEKGCQKDFSKAFDQVNHSLLVHKLQQYGIYGRANRWPENFLSDRKQAVVVNGLRLAFVLVESGVPQGSVLGPSRFLLYINDLPEQLTSTCRLFAYDTICHKDDTDPQDQKDLQPDLDSLADWEQRWKMSFHL